MVGGGRGQVKPTLLVVRHSHSGVYYVSSQSYAIVCFYHTLLSMDKLTLILEIYIRNAWLCTEK